VATDSNGYSKGYGFVQFEDEKSAKNAINGLNGVLSNGRIFVACLFIRRQDRRHICGVGKFTNVYVRNFPGEVNDNDLHQLFAPFGEITSIVVIKYVDGKNQMFWLR
jgi:polyadenylate-binding protein